MKTLSATHGIVGPVWETKTQNPETLIRIHASTGENRAILVRRGITTTTSHSGATEAQKAAINAALELLALNPPDWQKATIVLAASYQNVSATFYGE